MCICFWGSEMLPELAFLLCFNRDEFNLRPTEPTHFWHDAAHILAARDLERGGTWLGLTHTGRVAFLTNIRAYDPDPGLVLTMEHKRSRGELITNFLSSTVSPLDYCQHLRQSDYHGFNLVCADLATGSVAYTNNSIVTVPAGQLTSQPTRLNVSNGAVSLDGNHQQHSSEPPGGCWPSELDPRQVPVELQPGKLYGMSNGLLMEWPKVHSGLLTLRQLLHQTQQHAGGVASQTLPWDALFTTLLGDTCRDESQRPVDPSTGQPLPDHQLAADKHLEYVASSRFLQPFPSKFGPYGTRTQTVLAVWKDGTVELRERDLELEAQASGSVAQHDQHRQAHQAAQQATAAAAATEVAERQVHSRTQSVGSATSLDDLGLSTSGSHCAYSREVLSYESVDVELGSSCLAGAWRTTRHSFVMHLAQRVETTAPA